MHVASLRTQITPMVMTKALAETGIAPEAAIIDYMPTYWSMGPNIEEIIFDHLLRHNSGLAYGATNWQST
jgi:hypothetical protein